MVSASVVVGGVGVGCWGGEDGALDVGESGETVVAVGSVSDGFGFNSDAGGGEEGGGECEFHGDLVFNLTFTKSRCL